MKKILLLIVLSYNFMTPKAYAQCGAGYTSCSLNWDYLQFFPSAGLGSYTNLAQSQTQRFAFGTQRVTITHNYASGLASGTSTAHTGETGTFGSGADVLFSGNGLITVTFQNGVRNVQFSVYDIDRSQDLTVASIGNTVTMAKVSGSVLTVTGSGTSSALAASTNTTVGTTSTDGAVNVTINSATIVTSFTIAITGSTGSSNDFYLSDITACSAGSFTNNYFQISKPLTNQAAYVLLSKDNEVYYADVNSGKAKLLFTAPIGSNDINAMAYDPVKHYVYYIQDNPTPLSTNKTLYRYHYDMDTTGIVMNDVTSLFPTFDAGVESGGAAFYDGSLYFGVDLGNSSTYKCIVWRIDFDASSNPIAASEVFAIDGAGHDWGDFAVAKGTLFNFDGQAGSENYHHQDLYTKNVITYSPSGSNLPKQTSVDWNSNIYSVGDYTITSPYRGMITPYNENGTLNTAGLKIVDYNGTQITGQWRDGAEAFKPKIDFGDAPASYDPVSGDPGTNEISSLLYLGNNSSNEWVSRGQTAAANSDNFDDGMVLGSVVNPTTGTFFTQVKFFNNTGSLATVAAWVDFNNNGVYDAGEGKVVANLPSSASSQNVSFNWTGVSTTLTEGSYAYVRYRIALTSTGLGVANATGFFGDGEVEDYRVIVTTNPLETNLVSFNATKNASGEASVTWEVANEQAGTLYTIQRSIDSKNWQNIKTQQATGANASNNYDFTDASVLKNTIYYKLKLTTTNNVIYSEIRKLNYGANTSLSVSPNPAANTTSVSLVCASAGIGKLLVFDATGRTVISQSLKITSGTNKYLLDVSMLKSGLYKVRVENDSTVLINNLLIEK